MAPAGTIFTPDGYHRSWRAQVAAKYSGAQLKLNEYVPGVTDECQEFASKFPKGVVPVFEGKDGTCLFDANAIAYYLGNENLRGGKLEHLVTQWVNYVDNVMLPAIATWVYPGLSLVRPNKQVIEKAKKVVDEALAYLNKYLSSVTYLVGQHITQADITVFTAVHLLMTNVCDEACRQRIPHVMRWFLTVAHQPELQQVVGAVNLCQKEVQFDDKKFTKLHHAGEVKQKVSSQTKEKHKPAPAKEHPPKDNVDDEEEPVEKPSKNILSTLPAGKFNMDEFKRTYSNQDIMTEAIPYFWNNYDPEAYSLWHCEYKYPEELRLIFMSCNLIGGMFQRLEKMNKYAFGSVCVFGEDNKSTISGLWFWRGTGLVFELDPDLQIDYESYTWRKLDPNSAEVKLLVQEYFTHVFQDKKFCQGKIFK